MFKIYVFMRRVTLSEIIVKIYNPRSVEVILPSPLRIFIVKLHIDLTSNLLDL